MKFHVFPTVVLSLGIFSASSIGQETARPAQATPTRAELEKKFEETMSGASLIGYFTVAGAEKPSAPKDDQYRVSKIEKMPDGRWLFTASMSYGDRSVAIPMPFEVQWAGDTPVITLTDQTIPGLGTFSARVLIYEGHYAGTWKHGQVGGHMWGKVVK
jgi:hypothetical protein